MYPTASNFPYTLTSPGGGVDNIFAPPDFIKQTVPFTSSITAKFTNPRDLASYILNSNADKIFESCGGVFVSRTGTKTVQSGDFEIVYNLTAQNGDLTITSRAETFVIDLVGCPNCYHMWRKNTLTYQYNIATGNFTVSQENFYNAGRQESSGTRIETQAAFNGTASGNWRCGVTGLTKPKDPDFEPFKTTPNHFLYAPYVNSQLDQAGFNFEQNLLSELKIPVTRNSGYRTPMHQAHLYDISVTRRKLVDFLKKAPEQANVCKVVADEISKEIKDHDLTCTKKVGEKRVKIACGPNDVPVVGQTSNHNARPALAIDYNNVGGQAKELQPKIDQIAKKQNLYRPYIDKDPVHFQMIGSPVNTALRVTMQSPVDILVTNPAGKKIGFAPSLNSVVNQIGEFANYTGPGTEPQIIEIDQASPGDYSITGIGTGTGPYTLTIEHFTEDGELLDSRETSGIISPGQTISEVDTIAQPAIITINPNNRGAIATISIITNGTIPVAILSTPNFDATTQINRTSITFGGTGNEKSLASPPQSADVNGDGLPDLLCYFKTRQTGLSTSSVVGKLKGKLINNISFEGEDWIKVLPSYLLN